MTAGLPAIAFRSLTRADLPLLHEWLTRPHVAEWWGTTPSRA
ncbi:MAG: GNAT family N-acetyltransferase, partial [Gemmatimonadales bacterium]|nr:GNAT family N-acetyltransferase [Gemmatimonadales bacterium]